MLISESSEHQVVFVAIITTTHKPPHHNNLHHHLLSLSSSPPSKSQPIKCSRRVHQDVVHVRWAWPNFRSATVHLVCPTKRDHRRLRRRFCETWIFRPARWRSCWRPAVVEVRDGARGSSSDHGRCRCGATSAGAASNWTIGIFLLFEINIYGKICK